MKLPSKGTPVPLENGGTPLFVGGRNLQSENAKVLLKYEGGGLDEGYGQGIVTISYDEFKERRVHPEQLPSGKSISDLTCPNNLRPDS